MANNQKNQTATAPAKGNRFINRYTVDVVLASGKKAEPITREDKVTQQRTLATWKAHDRELGVTIDGGDVIVLTSLANDGATVEPRSPRTGFKFTSRPVFQPDNGAPAAEWAEFLDHVAKLAVAMHKDAKATMRETGAKPAAGRLVMKAEDLF